ncbi:MAG: hypothetical protein K2X56_04630 [Mycobacterium pseudokansasii]|uniref:Uncharacterized protein n=1 Tax=Mycobacterium pseudokansasii TaxID=2341080 RepID=A0A498QTN9_9MYCO|nr:hypothetical protein [Mycobacterium pseudokansasii]KZS69260.1 hypothetical protein A4G27_01765 [Mycobacterium kansasii]MBY0387395.1 hypothetical protein [Mycobacterium pseudokansasii]VAZ96349.1 hypothetical protein LAUMK35_03310 [Mycobacterium pseudokansasii]VAZ97739.1 hypothetical protein LAUMK21_03308 [Mycobacterium pseudokansasii]VBA51692.1 hypothetical protein LAUMK142_03223 [Mycobacterium pseudokansasii]
MKEPIDWIRATFTGAIAGGFLWAIMLKAISIATHEHFAAGDFYRFVSWVSLILIVTGVALYFGAKGAAWRGTAIGIILAPLTGWSILLFVNLLLGFPSWRMH